MKKLVKIIAALVVLVILALVAIPFFVSSDMLKAKVVAELSKATGRSISIDGKASLKLFPVIAVSLEEVTLGNPAGDFQSKRMFYAKKLETGVELLPLLHKDIIITGVTLDGAEINLEQNAAGEKNWAFASKPQSETAQAQPTEEKKKSAIAIGDISIKDSSLGFSKAGAAPIALSAIDVDMKGADGSKPLSLKGSMVYKEQKVSVSIASDSARDLMAGKSSSLKAEITLPGGNISFDGTAATTPSAKGKLEVALADLPELLQWATGKPATAATPKKFSLISPLVVEGKQYRFDQLTASADGMTATGKLAADVSGAVPSISGSLSLGMLDMAAFSGGNTKMAASAPAAPSEGWSSQPIDLSALKAVNAKLAVDIGGIKSGKLTLGNTALNIDLLNGAAKIIVNKLALYGGNAAGSFALSPGGLSTAMDVSGVQIEPLATDLSGQSRLKGTTGLKWNLTASGNSQRAWVSSLNGTVSFTTRDGAIKGINIAQFLRDAKKGFILGTDESKSTDFAELGCSFNFANGIGTTKDIDLKAPILRLSGSGTVSLPTKTLNLKLLPTLVTSVTGQGGQAQNGLAIPLLVSGSWSAPSITPDVKGMLENPDALKQNLKNLQGSIKNFNSPSDIMKALGGGGAAAPAATAPATTTAPVTDAAPLSPAAQKKADEKAAKQQAIQGLFNALSK